MKDLKGQKQPQFTEENLFRPAESFGQSPKVLYQLLKEFAPQAPFNSNLIRTIRSYVFLPVNHDNEPSQSIVSEQKIEKLLLKFLGQDKVEDIEYLMTSINGMKILVNSFQLSSAADMDHFLETQKACFTKKLNEQLGGKVSDKQVNP